MIEAGKTTKIWRCQTCFRVNSFKFSLCSKCGLPQHQDTEPQCRFAAKVFYSFQTILMFFGVMSVLALKPGFFASISILLLVWWLGLGLFAAQLVGEIFDIERKTARSLIESQTSPVRKLFVQTAYFVLYWPILVSKTVYFWSSLCAVAVYYGLKLYYAS